MYLVVGLGNPGREHARNRHNAGWMVVATVTAPTKVVEPEPTEEELAALEAEAELAEGEEGAAEGEAAEGAAEPEAEASGDEGTEES